MRLILLYLLLLVSSFTLAQKQYLCNITIDEYPNSKVLLADFYGDKNSIIDTAFTNEKGEATFIFNDDNYSGLYRVYFGNQNKFFDFIFNQEEITLETEFDFPMDSVKVIKSLENTIYYNFLRADREYKLKFELLTPVIAYYPKADKFYDLAADKYEETQKARNDYIRKIKKDNPNSFAAGLALFQLKPVIPSSLSEREMHQLWKLR